jgi:hypothetical protein
MGCHGRPKKFKFKRSEPNFHYYLQQAVTSNWMGSIAHWEHTMGFFQGLRRQSVDNNGIAQKKVSSENILSRFLFIKANCSIFFPTKDK